MAKLSSLAAEEHLVTGLRNGDRAVVRELYERYYAGIRTLVTQNSGSVDDARDVFQEGLMVVYTKAQSADGLTLSSSLFSFLRQFGMIHALGLELVKPGECSSLGGLSL